IAGQAWACAGVGRSNERVNQSRTWGVKPASGSVVTNPRAYRVDPAGSARHVLLGDHAVQLQAGHVARYAEKAERPGLRAAQDGAGRDGGGHGEGGLPAAD